MENRIIMAIVAILIVAAPFIAYIWQGKKGGYGMNTLFLRLKNFVRKKFRIVNNEVHCPEAFHPYWYRIEQRYTILFFLHWWGTPCFEPPHNFEKVNDAVKHIKEHYPNAIIYDCYSGNKCKK